MSLQYTHYSVTLGGYGMAVEKIGTSQAARILGISEQRVRQLADEGVLRDVEVTPLGRLYNRAEVEALKQTRS